MKFISLSDTHGQHRKLILPKGDVLIHAGDVSKMGKQHEIEDFIDWFGNQNFKYKLFIAGNHDFWFENATDLDLKKMIPKEIVYLNDGGIDIEGFLIWGSPITPWFYDWAFNKHRGGAIAKHWELIPANTDILITHGPVHGILDRTFSNIHAGCEDLKHAINRLKPKVHICGHIHEGYGMLDKEETLFINASVLNLKYELVNAVVEFEL
jgi:Icc-related predicted phosphoesterase